MTPLDQVPWTAGPWPLVTVPTSCGVCHKIGEFPKADGKTSAACVYVDYNSHADEMLANAKLIAESPTMAALLEEAVKRFKLYEMDVDSEATADHRNFMRKCEEVLSRLGRGK